MTIKDDMEEVKLKQQELDDWYNMELEDLTETSLIKIEEGEMQKEEALAEAILLEM